MTTPMKNTANTDVKFYAGHLLAMWYLGGAVYQCRPDDLSTVGKLALDPRVAHLPISAHSKVDERTGEFSGYASTFGGEPDSYGDIIAPSAFKGSLREHEKRG